MTIQWTDAITDKICDALAGGEEIYKIAGKNGVPSKASIYRQMAKDAAFETRIARARVVQQEAQADGCVEMADKATPENWQVVKLRIWARQWRAAKLAPKKYGERPEEIADTGKIEVIGGLPPDDA